MSIKKSILSASAMALAVTTVVGGTLAYNTAEDSAVNLQDSGYVDIVQHEYQRKDKTVSTNNKGETPELIPFVQGQSLYPAYADYDSAKADNYGSPWTAHQSDLMYWGGYVKGNTVSEGAGNGLFEAKYLTGALDKFVFVENTGSSDCYFRTVIAFECPEGLTIGDASVDDIGTNVNSGYTWVENDGEQFTFTEIDGTRYAIAVGVYTGWNGGVLTPGETARPSLLQVAFSEKMTNEQSKLFGDSYEILVYTQACQTKNLGDDPVAALNTVFGEITADNNPWVTDGVTANSPFASISNIDELKAAIKDAGENPVVIDADGAELDLDEVTFNDGSIVKNAVVNGTDNYGNNVNGTVTFINCTFDAANAYAAHFDGGNGDIVFKNCTFYDWNSFGTVVNSLTFDNCVFDKNGTYGVVRVYQNAKFTDCTFKEDFMWIDTNVNGTVVEFNNCSGLNVTTQLYNNGDVQGIWMVDGETITVTNSH